MSKPEQWFYDYSLYDVPVTKLLQDPEFRKKLPLLCKKLDSVCQLLKDCVAMNHANLVLNFYPEGIPVGWHEDDSSYASGKPFIRQNRGVNVVISPDELGTDLAAKFSGNLNGHYIVAESDIIKTGKGLLAFKNGMGEQTVIHRSNPRMGPGGTWSIILKGPEKGYEPS